MHRFLVTLSRVVLGMRMPAILRFALALLFVLPVGKQEIIAQEIQLLGGIIQEDDSRDRSTSWAVQYLHDLNEPWAVSFSWLNEGHFEEHHRDGHALQLWARTKPLGKMVVLAAGIGPYQYYDKMHFLPDVYVTCDVCGGKRFNRDTLEIKYKGKSVAEVLDMTVQQALGFFENIPAIRSKLLFLSEVGLGYLRLGQSATTLSGGEAQRIKLSRELAKRTNSNTL